jgi:RNA polymerase sigma-70 factor (ECF subfamily)
MPDQSRARFAEWIKSTTFVATFTRRTRRVVKRYWWAFRTVTGSDIAQQALQSSVRNLDQCESKDRKQFEGWVGRIAYNKVMQHLRFRRRRDGKRVSQSSDYLPSIPAPDHADHPADRADMKLASVLSAFNDLPERRRQVMELRFRHQLSREEIADKLGVSLSTVDKEIQAARVQLGNIRDQDNPDGSDMAAVP